MAEIIDITEGEILRLVELSDREHPVNLHWGIRRTGLDVASTKWALPLLLQWRCAHENTLGGGKGQSDMVCDDCGYVFPDV